MAEDFEDTYIRLDKLADTAELDIQKAFLETIIIFRTLLGSTEDIAILISTGEIYSIYETKLQEAVAVLETKLVDVFYKAGESTAEFLSKNLEDSHIIFDKLDTYMVETLTTMISLVLRYFVQEQVQVLYLVLLDGVNNSLNFKAQASILKNSIGLTFKQIQAVKNYEELLKKGASEALRRRLRNTKYDSTLRRAIKAGKPLSKQQIARMVAEYIKNYLKYRAEILARTEAQKLTYAGSEYIYSKAINEGKLDKDKITKTWISKQDSRVRDSHMILHDTTVKFDEVFKGLNGNLRFPGDPNAPLSETANCRCALITKINT